MDPVSLIVAALVAGATAGTSDVAASGVKDAYAALRRLLVRRFRSRVPEVSGIDSESVLEAHAHDAVSWEGPLAAALRAAEVDKDVAVVQAARDLLAKADPEGSAHGKYVVDVRGAQGVQIGDGGTMRVSFGGRAGARRGTD